MRDQELIDRFFAELDFRIEGGRDTPVDSRAVLTAMRPVLAERSKRDPDGFTVALRDSLEKWEMVL